jgi:hypothetical protein
VGVAPSARKAVRFQGMTHCYQCGAAIPPADPQYRRDVYTGGSQGTWLSRRSLGVSARRHHGPRTLCAVCAGRYDRATKVKVVAAIVIVLIALIAGASREPSHPRQATVAHAMTDSGGNVSAAALQLKVVSTAANIRAEPSTSAAIVTVRPQGAELTLLERRGAWLRVADSATPTASLGWIHRTLAR